MMVVGDVKPWLRFTSGIVEWVFQMGWHTHTVRKAMRKSSSDVLYSVVCGTRPQLSGTRKSPFSMCSGLSHPGGAKRNTFDEVLLTV
jgi:hypothetical protein